MLSQKTLCLLNKYVSVFSQYESKAIAQMTPVSTGRALGMQGHIPIERVSHDSTYLSCVQVTQCGSEILSNRHSFTTMYDLPFDPQPGPHFKPG